MNHILCVFRSAGRLSKRFFAKRLRVLPMNSWLETSSPSPRVPGGGKEKTPEVWSFFLERVKGIEPSSSAWKADIMSHYTTPARKNGCLTLSKKRLFCKCTYSTVLGIKGLFAPCFQAYDYSDLTTFTSTSRLV